jgi:hypothetical protein
MHIKYQSFLFELINKRDKGLLCNSRQIQPQKFNSIKDIRILLGKSRECFAFVREGGVYGKNVKLIMLMTFKLIRNCSLIPCSSLSATFR